MTAFTPRTPKGIRRHYDRAEEVIVSTLGTSTAHTAIQRPENGIEIKKLRMAGVKDDSHLRDGSGKYRHQAHTKSQAKRNGQPWESWEDQYLLANADIQPLASKALTLARTYRAVESRRRDLLRKIDHQRSTTP